MADRDLTNILDKRAAFGANFLGTTNLAQRRRYQEDIEAAEVNRRNMRQERLGAAMEAAELEDPIAAANLRVNQQRESRMFEQGERELDLRERQMLVDEEAAILRRKLERDKQELALMEIKQADKVRQDTYNLRKADADAREMGHHPGDEAYAQWIYDALGRSRDADATTVTNVLKLAKIEDDPELVYDSIRNKKGLNATISADGRTTYRIRGGAEEPEQGRSKLWNEYSKLINLSKEAPEEDRDLIRQELQELSKQIRSSRGGNENTSKTRPSTAKALVAGDVVDGFEFRGGDPKDQANWLKK